MVKWQISCSFLLYHYWCLYRCVCVYTCVQSCVWMRVPVSPRRGGQGTNSVWESFVLFSAVCPARWPSTSQDPPGSFPTSSWGAGIVSAHTIPADLMEVLGIQIQVFMLAWQMLLPLSHLPVPVRFLFFYHAYIKKTWGALGKTFQSEAVSQNQMVLRQSRWKKIPACDG